MVTVAKSNHWAVHMWLQTNGTSWIFSNFLGALWHNQTVSLVANELWRASRLCAYSGKEPPQHTGRHRKPKPL